MTLFDDAGRVAAIGRDEGIARAMDAAGDRWADEAYDFVTTYLEAHAELFVDDLWDAGLPVPANRKALGGVIQRAKRSGLMTESGQFRPSVSSHLLPKPVWTSLIQQGEDT